MSKVNSASCMSFCALPPPTVDGEPNEPPANCAAILAAMAAAAAAASDADFDSSVLATFADTSSSPGAG